MMTDDVWNRRNDLEQATFKLIALSAVMGAILALQSPTQAHALSLGFGWFAVGACAAMFRWRDRDWIGGVVCALSAASVAAECVASF